MSEDLKIVRFVAVALPAAILYECSEPEADGEYVRADVARKIAAERDGYRAAIQLAIDSLDSEIPIAAINRVRNKLIDAIGANPSESDSVRS